MATGELHITDEVIKLHFTFVADIGIKGEELKRQRRGLQES